MIQGKNITIVHKKDLKEIVKDVRFCLNPGDKAVIIGEEGNGKSTLLKWLYDPKLVEAYAQAQGERIFAGERLGYLPQELPEGYVPWEVFLYPPEGDSSIIEILLHPGQ